MDRLTWLVNNTDTIVEALIALLTVASVLTRLTRHPEGRGLSRRLLVAADRLSVLKHQGSPGGPLNWPGKPSPRPVSWEQRIADELARARTLEAPAPRPPDKAA